VQIIKSLHNIEFGRDPYQLFDTPRAVDQTARVYLTAREAMSRAACDLAAWPSDPDRADALLHARDALIFASGDLWQALRSGGHYHQVFEIGGCWVYLSDAQGPNRPHIMAVDAKGNRLCPVCYGAGVYQGMYGDDEFRPCPCCQSAGFLQVKLPGCTRKELVL
jgi:hypothetical protein